MSKPYDGTNEEAVLCLSKNLRFIDELETSYELINQSYQLFNKLVYQCYQYLRDTQENTPIPESTSTIIGILASVCYEIQTSKELINRIVKVANALERD